MADPIGMGVQAGVQALRFGWYLGLNRLVGWQSDRLGLRPRYKAQRPVPSERDILAELGALFLRDAQAVRDGIFPPLPDGLGPLEHLDRARTMLADLPAALERRASEDAATARSVAHADDVPEYYAQDFHYQTGGYLTEQSARLYDMQVETLFLGGAAPMRREALRPIAGVLRGRDQRRVALADIACGTGRFLRDVRLVWPALRLTGIDLSEPYLAEAACHMRGLRPANLIRANAEDIPLPDASQDIVTTIFLFHELPHEARRRIATEMARVLKPGGLMVLVDSLQMGDCPAWDGLLEGFPVRFHEPYFADYAVDDLDRLLGAAGLAPHSVWTSFLAKVIVRTKPHE
ncbi:MAG: methyltransferase domain-containing protein [Hyphomicrobiaceae bacterium]|nr:methyltransferase domain-containing protein [Hyphomicrobiaceae bacterium]